MVSNNFFSILKPNSLYHTCSNYLNLVHVLQKAVNKSGSAGWSRENMPQMWATPPNFLDVIGR